jgi:hypothetical protein
MKWNEINIKKKKKGDDDNKYASVAARLIYLPPGRLSFSGNAVWDTYPEPNAISSRTIW